MNAIRASARTSPPSALSCVESSGSAGSRNRVLRSAFRCYGEQKQSCPDVPLPSRLPATTCERAAAPHRGFRRRGHSARRRIRVEPQSHQPTVAYERRQRPTWSCSDATGDKRKQLSRIVLPSARTSQWVPSEARQAAGSGLRPDRNRCPSGLLRALESRLPLP